MSPGLGRCEVLRPHPQPAHDEDGQNHPYDAQRIGHRAAQRRAVGGNPQLVERLLRRTERRRVGRRAAQHAHHFGQRHGGDAAQQHRHAGSDGDDAQPLQVEPHAAPVERAEETGPHLQPERVDEEHQSETLGVFEHRLIDRQPTWPARIPTKKTNVTPSETPPMRTLPSAMPAAQIRAMTTTACRAVCSTRRVSIHSIDVRSIGRANVRNLSQSRTPSPFSDPLRPPICPIPRNFVP